MSQSYNFSTGVIKVRETRLLNSAKLRGLAELSPEDFLSFLKDTEYGKFLDASGNFDDTGAWRENGIFLKKLPAAEEVLNLLLVRNDFLDAKLILKINLLKYKFEEKAVPEYLKTAVRKVLAEKEIETNPALIDFILDAEYFNFLKAMAEKFSSPFLKELIVFWIDLYNLRALFRVKTFSRDKIFIDKFLVRGGAISLDKIKELYQEDWEGLLHFLRTSGKFSGLAEGVNFFLKEKDPGHFEKEIMDLEMNLVRGAKFFAYGPAALIGYALAKEREIKNLKIIFVAKKSGLSPEKILKLLGEAYV